MAGRGRINGSTVGLAVAVAMLLFASPSGARPIYFQPADVYTTGGRTEAVAIGDVTSDGRDDVLLSTASYNDPENDNKLFVYAQASDGTLVQVQKLDHGSAIGGPVVGDFDGDGDGDVAIGTSVGVRVFAQEDGTLSPHVALPGVATGPGPVETEDMNADGAADLVLTGGGVSALIQGSEGYSLVPVSAPGVESIATGDVSGNELPDVVALSTYDQDKAIHIYEQQEDGGFAPRSIPLDLFDDSPNKIAVGDATGDGLEDIVVTDDANQPANLEVYRQTDAGTVDPEPDVYPSYGSPDAVKVLDMNGDGLDDVAVAHAGSYRIGVYLQGPDGYLYEERLIPAPLDYGADAFALGDVSSDGLADLAFASNNRQLVVRRQKLPFDLSSAGQADGRITATWTRPTGMSTEFIEVATSPDTYPEGRLAGLFLDPSIVLYDDSLRRDQESYVAPEPLPPGTYYVHVRAWDDEICSAPDGWGCPDEVSATREVTIPGGPASGTKPAPPADKVVRFASLRAARRQPAGNLAVRASLAEAGTVSARGTVIVPNSSRTYRLRAATARAAAGATVTLRPKLSKRTRRAVLHALRHKKRVMAKITVTARDRAGNTRKAKVTIRLAR